MSDDRCREAMAAIGQERHARSYLTAVSRDAVNVTMPLIPRGSHPAVVRRTKSIGSSCIGGFNDLQETVGPVLAAFDRAIAAGG
jgi:hypothetical protein